MREIKFRAQRKLNAEWVYGSYVKGPTEDDDLIIESLDETLIESVHVRVITKTVGQFTGFVDKNKKHIYEGDIISDDYGHIWDVQFINGCFWLHREGHGGMTDAKSWPNDCYPMYRVNHELYSKVVTNIY